MVDLSRFGTKHECFTCGAKFYDLNKPNPACPKCGEAVGGRKKKKSAAKVKPAPVIDLDDIDGPDDDAVDGDAFEGLDTDVGLSDGDDDDFDDDAGEEYAA